MRKRSLVILFSLLLFLSVVTAKPPYKYSRLNVLVVVFLNVMHNGVKTSLVGRNLTKIFIELDRARLFYWRNSCLKLYINFTYVIVTNHVKFEGWWLPDSIARRSVNRFLRKVGLNWDDFDGVVVLWAAPNYREEPDPIGSVWGPGGTVYKYSSYQSDGAIAWLFVHEFHHQVDEDFHNSGFPEYPHADYPAQLKGKFGEHFDFNAYILRSWSEENWLKLKAPSTGKPRICTAIDSDNDGFPDYAPNLPFDEIRFGSYVNCSDSDGDGLSDRDEFIAGIFFPTDPLSTDSDGDGILDGVDSYLLYPVTTYIVENNWTTIIKEYVNYPVNRMDYRLEALWNESYLAFKIVLGEKVDHILIHLDLDDNGWFHGKANYELIISPETGEIVKAHVLDCSEAEENPKKTPLWDDDPKHGYRLVFPSDFKVKFYVEKQYKIIEIYIPKNSKIEFIPCENKSIGLRLEFRYVNGSWASIFERYHLVYLTLVKKIPKIVHMKAEKVPPPCNEDKAIYLKQYVEVLTEKYAKIVVFVENYSFKNAKDINIKIGNNTLHLGYLKARSMAKLRYTIFFGKEKTITLPIEACIEYTIGSKKYVLKYNLPLIMVSTEKPAYEELALMRKIFTMFILLVLVFMVVCLVFLLIKKFKKLK